MAKTVSELLSILEDRTKKKGDSNAHKIYLKSELDLAIRYHTNISYNWNELYVTGSVAGLTGESEFLAGGDISNIQYMWHTLNQEVAPINLVSKDTFYQKYLSTTYTGEPDIAHISKITSTYGTISTARVLTIYSSSSSDIGVPVRINGIVNGLPDYETITTNNTDGTTSVSGSKAFSEVTGVTKNGSTVGSITVSSVPTVLVVLPSGILSAERRFTYFKIYPILDQDTTIYFLKKRKQYGISDDNDFPILSDNHDDAILKYAEYNILKNDKMLKDYKRLRNDLISNEPVFNMNLYLQKSFNDTIRNSNLGSNYGI